MLRKALVAAKSARETACRVPFAAEVRGLRQGAMDLLSFLAAPAFVVPWYAVGMAAAAWVWHDLRHANTPLKTAIKWAWPIVVLFFSVLGLALYLLTARAPGIAAAVSPENKKRIHDDYERAMWRRVNGAVIHCVAGDGLGIMTAMVIARALSMSFWQEFWFEYAVGFGLGWFIFQYKSMAMMTDSKLRALAMAFRAEFFSMLTVMGGMGAVMAFITPSVLGMQPKPDTAAFWGFGMLGLVIGYLFTYPMNWMIVKIGWKHGMGSTRDARPVRGRGAKAALFAAMSALGVAAMVLPGWLAVLRERHEAEVASVALARFDRQAQQMHAGSPTGRGLQAGLQAAREALLHGSRRDAMAALDDAGRAAQVARAAALAPGSHADLAIGHARHALQNGQPDRAEALLEQAASAGPGEAARARRVADASAYEGAPLLDAGGAVIGELRRVEGARAELALGGVRDFWGFWDLGRPQLVSVALERLVLGPAHVIGKTYAMLPIPPESLHAHS